MALRAYSTSVLVFACFLLIKAGYCLSISEKREFEKLDAKLDRIGNEMELIGGQVDTLVQKDKGNENNISPTSTTSWHPVTFVNASRNHTSEGTNFEVVYKIDGHYGDPFVSLLVTWEYSRLDPETGEYGQPKYYSHTEKFRNSDSGMLQSAIFRSPERGLLELIILTKYSMRYEARLKVDNLNTSSVVQHSIPSHPFLVTSSDPLLYRGEEDPVVGVKLKGPNLREVISNMTLDIQYKAETEDGSEVREIKCDLKDERDKVCSSFVKKEYWSSMDVDIVIKSSEIQPIGLTRISSNTEARDQLVTNVQLSKVISIRHVDLPEPYPADVGRVEVTTSGCKYFGDRCEVMCKVYGRRFTNPKMYRSRSKYSRENLSSVLYKVSASSLTYVTTMRVPDIRSGVRAENVTCLSHSSKNYTIVYNRTTTITYKGEARFSKYDSYVQQSETYTRLVCTIVGYPLPDVSGVLVNTNGTIIPSSNETVVRTSEVEQRYAYLFEIDASTNSDVTGLCEASNNTAKVAELKVTDIYVIHQDYGDYPNY
ncbi:uncharacterized protein LOC106012535 [Aplysia californica]|uniref:Uncharacterized protein LOC106012535 n=1 Tax=Aplysia californica TaxID=6500 RepID=A0ABM1A5H3_APLCA|nr:uncharacterized protein LOC106012535 [Aplysia californica]